MALTAQERERTRYHLGYGNISPSASLSFGVPVPQQEMFLVESAMNLLIDANAEDRVRRILNIMDGIENQQVAAQARMVADKLEDLTLRKEEVDQLEKEIRRWGMRLAEQLRVPVYAYSARYRAGGGMSRVGNIPVSG